MKNNILIFFLIRCVSHLVGQDVQSPIPHIPTSPQAEAFQRYGEYYVNYSTGVPDISIPLYEINHRGYKMPLALKYYPMPLRPGYNYDVFGHGWSLSVNSCISRTIEGLPDEDDDFIIQRPYDYLFAFGNNCEYESCLKDFNFVHDKFNAILSNGSSFEFVIDKINGVLNYTISNGRKVKISCNYNSGDIYSFTIVDEAGIKYTFSEGDQPFWGPFTEFFRNVSWQLTRIDLPYSSEPIIFSYENGIEPKIGTVCIEPKIIIGHHENIVRKNTSMPVPDVPEYMCKNVPNVEPHYYRMKLLSSINFGNNSIKINYVDQSKWPAYNYVNSIKVFESNTLIRDISLTYKPLKNIICSCNGRAVPLAKLENVTIKGSNPSDLPQKYTCEYKMISESFNGTDHWGYLNQGNHEEVSFFTLFIEYDLNYIFPIIQARVSNVQNPTDINPYYKIRLSLSHGDNRLADGPNNHGVLSRLIYPTGGYTDFEFESNKFLTSTDYNGDYIYESNNRVEAYGGGFRIKKITNYNTKGVAEIINYRYGEFNQSNMQHSGLGEAVVDPNILTYMIGSNNYVIPFPIRYMILGLDPNGEHKPFYSNPFETADWSQGAHEGIAWSCSFSATNFRNILNGRPPVIYPEVTVYYGDIGNEYNYTPEKTNGKTVYRFNIEDPNTGEAFFETLRYYGNTLSYEPKGYLYNNMKEKLDYKFNGKDYVLVKKEVYTMQNIRSGSIDWIYANTFPLGFYYQTNGSLGIFFSSRVINFGISLLNRKEITIYDNIIKNGVTTTTTYEYNNLIHMQPTDFITTQSNGLTTTERILYPHDYPSANNFTKSMRDANIINKPVEQYTIVDNKVTRGILNTYKTGADLGLNDITYRLETTTPLSFSSFFPSNYQGGFSINSYYKPDIVYDKYDKGNLIQYHKANDINVSYIWGYNNSYPIAEVRNAAVNQVAYTSFEDGCPAGWTCNGTIGVYTGTNTGRKTFGGSTLQSPTLPAGTYTVSFWAKGTPAYSAATISINGGNNINPDDNTGGYYQKTITLASGGKITLSMGYISIDEVRIYPSTAMMKTYTYDPLIGMTSATDENGKTTYYEYDSFGRLQYIKDQDRNIIQEYKYHYKE